MKNEMSLDTLPDGLKDAIEPHLKQIANAIEEWEMSELKVWSNEDHYAFTLKMQIGEDIDE